jgi:hypothetical protein
VWRTHGLYETERVFVEYKTSAFREPRSSDNKKRIKGRKMLAPAAFDEITSLAANR